MHSLTGCDLAGWRVEVWYEVPITTDERGEYYVGGYFTDRQLATAQARVSGGYGSDSKVAEVFVLTGNSRTGYILPTDPVRLSEEHEIRAQAVERARARLTRGDRMLLGLVRAAASAQPEEPPAAT